MSLYGRAIIALVLIAAASNTTAAILAPSLTLTVAVFVIWCMVAIIVISQLIIRNLEQTVQKLEQYIRRLSK